MKPQSLLTRWPSWCCQPLNALGWTFCLSITAVPTLLSPNLGLKRYHDDSRGAGPGPPEDPSNLNVISAPVEPKLPLKKQCCHYGECFITLYLIAEAFAGRICMLITLLEGKGCSGAFLLYFFFKITSVMVDGRNCCYHCCLSKQHFKTEDGFHLFFLI